MDLVLTLGILAVVYLLTKAYSVPVKDITKEKVIVTVKQCPPHQWFWQDMVDETGEVQGARMMCKVCGPLSDVLDRNVK